MTLFLVSSENLARISFLGGGVLILRNFNILSTYKMGIILNQCARLCVCVRETKTERIKFVDDGKSFDTFDIFQILKKCSLWPLLTPNTFPKAQRKAQPSHPTPSLSYLANYSPACSFSFYKYPQHFYSCNTFKG